MISLKRELTEDERRRIVEFVNEGKQSEYWKILKDQIERWIDSETKILDGFRGRRMTEKDIQDFNNSQALLTQLGTFLKINEVITYRHMTWLDKMKMEASFYINRIDSFVRRK